MISGRIVEITTRNQAIELTKHSGWCTGFDHTDRYWNDYFGFGELFIYYKDGKRRPSYQMFFPNGTGTKGFEMKRSGNRMIESTLIKPIKDLCQFIASKIGEDRLEEYLRRHERSKQTIISTPSSLSGLSGFIDREYDYSQAVATDFSGISMAGMRMAETWGVINRHEVCLDGSSDSVYSAISSILRYIPEATSQDDAHSEAMDEIGLIGLPFAINGSFSLSRNDGGEYGMSLIPYGGFRYQMRDGKWIDGWFAHSDANVVEDSPTFYSRDGSPPPSFRRERRIDARMDILFHNGRREYILRRTINEYLSGFSPERLSRLIVSDAVMACHYWHLMNSNNRDVIRRLARRQIF